MLSRAASELYWMARHIERAENTARLLDVTYRTSLMPYQVREPGLAWAEPWSVPLITLGLATAYYQRHSALTAENALRFMIFDPTNASSRSIVPNVTPRNRCERIFTQSRNVETPAASTRS